MSVAHIRSARLAQVRDFLARDHKNYTHGVGIVGIDCNAETIRDPKRLYDLGSNCRAFFGVG
jgi:hypothetical protein